MRKVLITGGSRGIGAETVRVFDWVGLLLVCFILPAVISWALCLLLRKLGWIREGDMKLE